MGPLFMGRWPPLYAKPVVPGSGDHERKRRRRLATNTGLTAVLAKNRQWLELYRAGKPYHEPLPNGK